MLTDADAVSGQDDRGGWLPHYFFPEVIRPIIESSRSVTFLAAVIGRASMPYDLAFPAVPFALGIASPGPA